MFKLRSQCQFYDILPQSFQWIDSQDIIKILVPTSNTLQLQSLLTSYNINNSVSHRAYDDALGLANLLLTIKSKYSLQLTSFEVSIFKKSSHLQLKRLIRFILTFFLVTSPKDSPIIPDTNFYQDLDERAVPSSIKHINLTQPRFIEKLNSITEKTLLSRRILFILIFRKFIPLRLFISNQNYTILSCVYEPNVISR